MDFIFLANQFNHWLGPLMMLGPIKIALLAWLGLELAKKNIARREREPAPEMPEQSSSES